ncbi:DgyrCDS12425 [Dimorphilus gyrociliatus]|uniref:Palmitoyltransferase n=1 Tax=Dimorphilus gyrociliatus TaxID=2664684 RepID=A0A7I8W865_9ANNE|nr:DgyrCDS12425 [Dimorphilus gyrociliatus]
MKENLDQPTLKSTGVGDGNDVIPCSNKCQTTERNMPKLDPVTLANMSIEEKEAVAKKLVQFQMNNMGHGNQGLPMSMLPGGKLQHYEDGKVGYVLDIHAAVDCMSFQNINEMVQNDPSIVNSKGNILVCVAVYRDKRLQNMTNYFLVSLSVADLFVAILVMPLRTAVDLYDGKWTLGIGVCIVWLTADVLMCTASIWHMCTMSLDRWLSLKYPMKYGRNKTAKWVLTKILFVWLISIAISSPVCVLGLMRTTSVYDGTYCLPKSRDFVLYGSVFAFYIPFAVMLVTYVLTLRILCRNQLTVHGRVIGSGSDEEALAGKRRKSEIMSKRTASNEKKASKVLGVIFSVFVILWTPFFVVNILSVVCPGGLTPLHKACLKGDRDLVALFIQHGSDVNAESDFGHTPIFFAAKRGNIECMHSLIESGCDLHAKDKTGRNVMHHAAIGGSVLAMYYLVEMHQICTKTACNEGLTPLHYIVASRNIPALRFLLKNNRSNLSSADKYGNTPLHVACQVGLSTAAFLILEKGGLRLLDITNNEGSKPIDMAKNAKDKVPGSRSPLQLGSSYTETINLLAHHMKMPLKDAKVRGPILYWWGLALMLTVCFFAVIIGEALHAQGLVTTMAMGYLGFHYSRENARINHVCGWPNPHRLGMFGGGLLHTIIGYFWKVYPVVSPLYPILTAGSVISIPFIALSFVFLLWKDPGVLKQNAQKEDGSDYTCLDIAKGLIKPESFCSDCELIPLAGTKHCRLCNQCMERMDHHCIFLNKCIGRNNHILFVRFIVCTFFAAATFIFLCYNALKILVKSKVLIAFLVESYIQQSYLVCLCLGNVAVCVWCLTLLHEQFQAVGKGVTTLSTLYGQNPPDTSTFYLKLKRFFNVLITGRLYDGLQR